ncbi:MAG: flagellar biosynthesis protein FlgN [Pseudomonadota bacterium]
MDNPIETDIDALEDLLDAERTALLAGKLDDVSRLRTRKERLISTLNEHGSFQAEKFEGVREKAKRNHVLLDSALNGIRSVTQRLSAIRKVRQSLETYDSFGRKQIVDIQTGGTLEKRS